MADVPSAGGPKRTTVVAVAHSYGGLGFAGGARYPKEVRVSSDPNLVVRLLKEQRETANKLSTRFEALAAEFREFRGTMTDVLTRIDHTIGGMASHLFAITNAVKDHDRRLRKLETRPSK